MGRRRELNSIATDIAQSLSSRNNDYLGYWATGQLHKLAKDNDSDRVRIDVLNKNMEPYTEHFRNIFDVYFEVLKKQLNARKLKMNWVSKFILEFYFEQERNETVHRYIGIGFPYTLNVLIESDLGAVHKLRVGGYCRPHDPNREERRSGF